MPTDVCSGIRDKLIKDAVVKHAHSVSLHEKFVAKC